MEIVCGLEPVHRESKLLRIVHRYLVRKVLHKRILYKHTNAYRRLSLQSVYLTSPGIRMIVSGPNG